MNGKQQDLHGNERDIGRMKEFKALEMSIDEIDDKSELLREELRIMRHLDTEVN